MKQLNWILKSGFLFSNENETMNLDPSLRKVVQVAEQAQLPIHVPVILGNECFIITQQDMRRIEDFRLFSYNKVNSKGELVPIGTAECNGSSINMCPQMQYQPNTSINQLNLGILPEILARAYNATMTMQHLQPQQPAQMAMPDLLQYLQQQNPTISIAQKLTPMAEFAPAAATLQQQLDWAKACETMGSPSATHPLHNTSATSTTEITRSQCMPQANTTNKRQCCSRACNTMDIDHDLSPLSNSSPMSSHRSETCLCARQQAKQRKMSQFGS